MVPDCSSSQQALNSAVGVRNQQESCTQNINQVLLTFAELAAAVQSFFFFLELWSICKLKCEQPNTQNKSKSDRCQDMD